MQATIPPHAGNLAQQSYDITDLSTQTATLKIKDTNKDKTADNIEAATEANYQTATGQVPAMISDSHPDTFTINGVKYVKEQPKVDLSAMPNVVVPSQNKKFGQPFNNTSDFTAGYAQISDQAELGNATSATVAPVNLEDHHAEHLTQQNRRQDAMGLPATTSAPGGASTGQQGVSAYTA